MADLLAALDDFRSQLVLWTAGIIILYALVSNLIYRARQNPQTRLGRILRRLDQRTGRKILYPILEFGFYVGLPYLALILGITNPRLMGLTPQNWVEGIGITMVLGMGAFLLLFGIWLFYLRFLKSAEMQKVILLHPTNLFVVLRGVIQFQAHWAFLRFPPLLLFGEYPGVFVGLALFYLEIWTNPYVRHGLFKEGQEENLHIASLALVAALVFYFTQNLWLTAALHLALELSLWGLLRRILVPKQGTDLQRVSP